VLFWSCNNVLAKAVIDSIPPFSLAFLRWIAASVIILPLAWPYLKKDWKPARKSWGRLLVMSVLGVSAFNTLLYIAVQTTSATNIGLISSIFPASIALLSYIVLKVSIARFQLVGMTVSFLGVLLVILRGDLSVMTSLKFVEGDLWMIACIVCGSFYSILLHERPDMHPLSFLAAIILLGTIALLPFYLWDLLQGRYLSLSGQVVATILFMAVFPSILSFLFWNRGIELLGANHAALFLNLVPVLTAAMAFVFLGEVLKWYHFAGLVMIIGGMLLFNPRIVYSLAAR